MEVWTAHWVVSFSLACVRYWYSTLYHMQEVGERGFGTCAHIRFQGKSCVAAPYSLFFFSYATFFSLHRYHSACCFLPSLLSFSCSVFFFFLSSITPTIMFPPFPSTALHWIDRATFSYITFSPLIFPPLPYFISIFNYSFWTLPHSFLFSLLLPASPVFHCSWGDSDYE